ncbi:MAG TPA: hypothetical protein VK638_49150 [Edaphobacter sp.]|nr:hypothetical protein [Edaphobacter sp.]
MRLSTAALAFFFVGTTALMSAQTTQSISGTVTDSMCGAHHMMKNASAAQCTRECVKNGSSFALVSGGKLYTLKGDKAMIDKWAGQNVTIQGKVDGTAITVETMSAK